MTASQIALSWVAGLGIQVSYSDTSKLKMSFYVVKVSSSPSTQCLLILLSFTIHVSTGEH